MLRCKQLKLSFEELDMITAGCVWDMLTELGNDDFKYPLQATQEQFDEFL